MADVTKVSNELVLTGGYSDGIDRTLTLANPKATVTAAEINALSELNTTNSLQSGFLGYKKATRRKITTIVYDLS
jgi:ribosomal protein L10